MSAARQSIALALIVLAALAAPATAQGDPVEQLIALLGSKPQGMGSDEWRVKRREAAIELGRRGDRRAVPALIQVIETEEFDIVVEHAIDALAKIGDQRAVPVLQKVAGDSDRDADARRKARAALDKLGASAAGPTRDPDPKDDGDAGGLPRGLGDRVLGGGAAGSGRVELPDAPAFPADTLAASERLIFGIGELTLSYDTIREIPALAGDATAAYERIRERERYGLDLAVNAGITGGSIDFPGPDNGSRTLALDVRARGEARAYFGGPIFAMAALALGTAATLVKIARPAGEGDDTSEVRLGLDGTLTVGAGYGRVLERGAEIRLRRIELALREARMLGRPITASLAEKILAVWWSLRGEISAHKQLIATISLLRDAGVLLETPDPTTTYKILRILEDGQLAVRPNGLQIAVGISETGLTRDITLDLEEGRVENVIARARFGSQRRDGLQELIGEAAARYRILANEDDGDPTPWLAVASAAFRRYMYTDTFDPIGALEIGAEVGASDDGFDDSPIASRVAGRIGWLFAFSRFSRVRIAGDVALESGELFVGASLTAAYGFLDVSFIGRPAAME